MRVRQRLELGAGNLGDFMGIVGISKSYKFRPVPMSSGPSYANDCTLLNGDNYETRH